MTALTLEFLSEAAAAIDSIASRDPGPAVRAGKTKLDVSWVPGKKANELECVPGPGSGSFGGGGGGGGAPGADEARGLMSGDVVGITPWPPPSRGGGCGDAGGGRSGGEAPLLSPPMEVEVVWSRPLRVKVTSQKDYAALLGGGRRWRVDKMANKITFNRQVRSRVSLSHHPSWCSPLLASECTTPARDCARSHLH